MNLDVRETYAFANAAIASSYTFQFRGLQGEPEEAAMAISCV
jgi:hypothetical protein